MDLITINVNFNNKYFKFKYNKNKFIFSEFKDDLNIKLNYKFNNKNKYNLLLTCNNKILNEKTICSCKSDNLDVIAINKNIGGVAVAMFGILVWPIYIISKNFLRIGELIGKMFEMLAKLIEVFFLIFKPDVLIDDILFAVTYSINEMMKGMSDAVSNGFSEPEDEDAEKGPFAMTESDEAKTCMSPTYSTIFLLILCPPLAIIYKIGFWKGFVSAIICGVLCVKLFYFPGLLFAILHVLC